LTWEKRRLRQLAWRDEAEGRSVRSKGVMKGIIYERSMVDVGQKEERVER